MGISVATHDREYRLDRIRKSLKTPATPKTSTKGKGQQVVWFSELPSDIKLSSFQQQQQQNCKACKKQDSMTYTQEKKFNRNLPWGRPDFKARLLSSVLNMFRELKETGQRTEKVRKMTYEQNENASEDTRYKKEPSRSLGTEKHGN